MKRILLALMTVAFLLPLAKPVQADTEVSLNFFYDNLADQGSWIDVADYGYCFQPNVAMSDSTWRPYADGYWAYTDAGWTWVSYEDFGWATYHYGRWTNLDDYGWVWVPGYEWGPAWVSWRTGGDYVGWAPLPPQGNEVVYEGSAITGAVDITFGIGPLYYNFIDIRYIGEPVLRARLIEPARNVTIINNTVNVTNITYNNSVVVNNGPDLNRVNRFSARPIQHLTLQRESNVAATVGQGGHPGNFNRVNGQQFVVAAPRIQKSPQQIAPRQVKAKVENPKIERGWQGVANRQQIEAGMKKENPKKISEPTFQPQKDRGAGAARAGGQDASQPNEPRSAAQNPPAAGNDQGGQRGARRLPRDDRNANAGQPNYTNPPVGTGQAQKEKPAGMNDVQAEREKNQPAATAGDQQAERAQQPRRAMQTQQAERTRPAAQGQAPDRMNRAAQPQDSERTNGAAQAQQSERMNRPAQAQQTQQQPVERAHTNPMPHRVQQAPAPDRHPDQQQTHRPQQANPQQPQGGNQNPDGEHKNKKKKPSEEPSPQG